MIPEQKYINALQKISDQENEILILKGRNEFLTKQNEDLNINIIKLNAENTRFFNYSNIDNKNNILICTLKLCLEDYFKEIKRLRRKLNLKIKA